MREKCARSVHQPPPPIVLATTSDGSGRRVRKEMMSKLPYTRTSRARPGTSRGCAVERRVSITGTAQAQHRHSTGTAQAHAEHEHDHSTGTERVQNGHSTGAARAQHMHSTVTCRGSPSRCCHRGTGTPSGRSCLEREWWSQHSTVTAQSQHSHRG